MRHLARTQIFHLPLIYTITENFENAAFAGGRNAGGVGHDSQSVPGEIFARAHYHLIAEGQTYPRAAGDVEIV